MVSGFHVFRGLRFSIFFVGAGEGGGGGRDKGFSGFGHKT